MQRFDIINYFIKKYGYKKYLEIGVEDGDCIKAVSCQLIHGVDPFSVNATHRVTSDTFFEMLRPSFKYDIIFIDGLHVEEQVTRDILNSLAHLEENGVIIVHDCNPPTEWHQRSYEEAKTNGCRLWNGTVWKSIVCFRQARPDLQMHVVDTDWGVGIIKRGSQELLESRLYTWEDFQANREKMLNLISTVKFLEMY